MPPALPDNTAPMLQKIAKLEKELAVARELNAYLKSALNALKK